MGGIGGELGKGGTDGGGREGGGRKGGGCDGGGFVGGAGGEAGGGSGEGGDLGALPGANGGRHGVGGYGGRGGGEKSSTLCIAGPNHSRARHERPPTRRFQVRPMGRATERTFGDARQGRWRRQPRGATNNKINKVFVHALHPTRARERTTCDAVRSLLCAPF